MARYRSLDIEDKECHSGGCWDVSVSGEGGNLFSLHQMFSLDVKYLRISFFCFDTDWSFTQVYCCEKSYIYSLRTFSMSEHPYQASISGDEKQESELLLHNYKSKQIITSWESITVILLWWRGGAAYHTTKIH